MKKKGIKLEKSLMKTQLKGKQQEGRSKKEDMLQYTLRGFYALKLVHALSIWITGLSDICYKCIIDINTCITSTVTIHYNIVSGWLSFSLHSKRSSLDSIGYWRRW